MVSSRITFHAVRTFALGSAINNKQVSSTRRSAPLFSSNHHLQQVAIVWRQITELSLLSISELTWSSVIPLPVLPSAANTINDTRHSRQANERNRDGISLLIEGLRITLQEDESRDDTSDVSEGNLPGGSHGTTVVTSQVHVEPADHDGHGCVAAHGDEEEGHVLHTHIVMDVEQCSESSQSDTDWDNRECQSVA